jgi:hypothetical protein
MPAQMAQLDAKLSMLIGIQMKVSVIIHLSIHQRSEPSPLIRVAKLLVLNRRT